MTSFLLDLLRLLPFFLGGHRQLALENLALRQQLAVYKRMAPRPTLRPMDRLFWVGLARAWTRWREALVIVSPDTVLRWQRRRFRAYCAKLSGRPTRGGPCEEDGHGESPVGAPRIHGELLKLGVAVGERTVTHLALDKDAPDLRSIELPAPGNIVEVPEVGGLHHRYLRLAA